MPDTQLTEKQKENWRKVMPILFGITGDMISDEDIQKLRDNLQKNIDEEENKQ